jgi:hypothetical protein
MALLGAPALFAQNDLPQVGEYAWHFPIHIARNAEFLSAEIPLEVYRSVSDSSMRDLGVYNGTGHAVPRIVKQVSGQTSQVENATALGIVPLYGELAESERRLQLLMQQHGDLTTLRFDSQLPGASSSENTLQAVIVDLRDHDDPLHALDFEWANGYRGFIGSVKVEMSSDLMNWRAVTQGTLAELEFEGTMIEQRRIELPGASGSFLRLTWREMPEHWRPESVKGISRVRGPERERQWITLEPSQTGEDGRSFVFDLGGYPPVDRVDLEFSGHNVVVRAAVDLRHDADHGWVRSKEGLFYRIQREGHEIQSSPAEVGVNRGAQWRVTLLTGQVSGDVNLRLGWQAEQLQFLSQGEPPFVLATGRAQDAVLNYPQQRMLGDTAIFSMLERGGRGGEANIGERLAGAGSTALDKARAWTWRTVLVWLGLIGAVLFVGYLVWSLMRENGPKPT